MDYGVNNNDINIYESENNSLEWVINMIITDNEASSVQSALSQTGVDVKITRLTHWEIIGANNSSLNEIEKTGELFNSNKEYIYDYKTEKNESSITFLIRQKEDMLGRQKMQSLADRFNIQGLKEIRHGVLWNIKSKSSNFDLVIQKVLDSKILFNPFSQECYKYG